ncbi:MAG: acetylornithine transaminase [Peptococcaceae bacterium]|nr:acetylornithine transaminase [Peptococcaceae bacterium]
MEELIAEGKQYLIPTYNPLPIVLERGEGCYVWDTNGKKYLDLVAGIAVNSLGGNHPAVVKAIQEQAAQIIHCSNLYWIKPQIKLAKLLVEKSGLDKAFFCNSGAEANEAAIKLARKWGQGEKYEIITLEKSFHGRTLGSLAATGQEKYQKAFRPLPAGFSAVPAGDLTALEQEIRPTTCAIMLEIIQGEGGINLPSPEYLQGIQELCQKYKLLLIIDEVQTGMGRTGKAFAFQHYGLKPDIISIAKALGNGVPLGAIAAKAEIADCFTPGDHGTTFGGNPLATAAGLASAEILLADDFLAQVTANGTYFQNALKDLQAQHPDKIADVRGLGLMLGCELTINAKDVSAQLLKQGVLVNTIGEHILRFVPPLIITKTEIDEFISLFKDILN